MKTSCYFLLCVFLLLSCKKEHLDEELTSLLIGEWQWIKTERSVQIIEETYTPESEGFDLTLDFIEKGILKIFKEDERIRRHRIKEVIINPISSDATTYKMDLSKNEGWAFTLRHNQNNRITSSKDLDFFDMPFHTTNTFDSYVHYFELK